MTEQPDDRDLTRVALEFYAYRGNYPLGPEDEHVPAVIEDGGWRARSALAACESGVGGGMRDGGRGWTPFSRSRVAGRAVELRYREALKDLCDSPVALAPALDRIGHAIIDGSEASMADARDGLETAMPLLEAAVPKAAAALDVGAGS